MGQYASGPSLSSVKDAEYKLAQSGDATCNGLDSAEVNLVKPKFIHTRHQVIIKIFSNLKVGSRIMSLRKPPIALRCDFPVWFKGPRHWHVLMGNAVYNYHTKYLHHFSYY